VERSETIKLFAIFKTAYPRFYVSQDRDETRLQIDLWTELLRDIPFAVIETAVKKLILESPHPPTISDVRKQIAEILQDPSNKDAAEAWGEVMRAIKNYGYYKPQEALASMSDRAAEVAKIIGWQEICTGEELGVTRGQFVKMYEMLTKRDKQEMVLPDGLKRAIRQIAEGQNLKLVEGGK